MLKIFLGRNSALQVMLLSLLYGFMILLVPMPTMAESAGAGPLYMLIEQWIQPFPVLAAVVSYVLLGSMAFIIPLFLQSYELSSRLSFLGGVIYLLLLFAFPVCWNFGPVLLVLLPSLMVIKRIFDLEEDVSVDSVIFGAAFVAGLATLIYLPAVFLLLFIVLGLLYMQQLSLRMILFVLLVFLIPLLFTFVYYFWMDAHQALWEDIVNMTSINVRQAIDNYFANYKVRSVLFIGVVLLALFSQFGRLYNQLIHIRRYKMLLVWFLILAFIAALWSLNLGALQLLLLFLPISMIFAHQMKELKKTRTLEIILWCVFMGDMMLALYKYI